MIPNLPEQFQEAMKQLLGTQEYPAFLASYDRPVRAGIRVNTLKCNIAEFMENAPFHLEAIPWIENGFYYDEADAPSHHPWYYAGMFYLQEPSAMTPASLLPVEKGDLVLDLCAAPGGKATELGARLKGTGFLLANDISNSRARALLRNLERFGIGNMAVCSESPETLLKFFPETFDKILIDAPCSGEGMFHKEPQMTRFWEEHGPAYYSAIQKKLILQAADMLKPGGMLLFSTCTFAPEENEGTVAWLLENRPEFSLCDVKRYEKFAPGLAPFEKAVRIYPQRMDGEGHFAVLFRKNGQKPEKITVKKGRGKEKTAGLPDCALEFLQPLLTAECFSGEGTWRLKNDQLYYIVSQPITEKRLRFLRTGLLAGECKKNRFEPSQALAMALKKEEFPLTVSFSASDPRSVRYLKGETVDVPEMDGKKGWILVCVDDCPMGFGKLDRGRIKNKYNAGWRML